MKFVKTFEKFDEEREKKPQEECKGGCDRQFYLKDDKPVVYCSKCQKKFDI
jgi:hypothetical protein